MLKKILIVNRGEIAVRIIRACRELGIISAAIYSEADRTSLHVRLADEAYLVGPAVSSESYLNKDTIIRLAEEIKADAIHPGYGFFSENSDFIKAVEKSGIVFIGPSSKSVAMMGSKTAARELMKKNGVPIVPGTTEPVNSVKEGIPIAKKIGFPILLKASAGGGGKGMRKISSESEFESAFDATRREALKAFGSDDVYIEKYIENPRHIEVQIIGDKHGNYAHLFERECSIQRRHQKIIEEAPSSFVDPATREKITEAGLNAAKACGYYNAGTIEFLMDRNKDFYFLEMNTRLQVEHPVTEMITGIDLVKEQIFIAAGKKLSFSQKDLHINGHALECRIYAEDPGNNFLPSTGTLYEYSPPGGNGVRLDEGFSKGSIISVYYDPLISKLVCWAKDRKSSINKMLGALEEYKIAGVINNIDFLKKILKHKDFIGGDININFIADKMSAAENNHSSQKKDEHLTNIAAIFTAVLKENIPHANSNGHSSIISSNKWTDLLYE